MNSSHLSSSSIYIACIIEASDASSESNEDGELNLRSSHEAEWSDMMVVRLCLFKKTLSLSGFDVCRRRRRKLWCQGVKISRDVHSPSLMMLVR